MKGGADSESERRAGVAVSNREITPVSRADGTPLASRVYLNFAAQQALENKDATRARQTRRTPLSLLQLRAEDLATRLHFSGHAAPLSERTSENCEPIPTGIARRRHRSRSFSGLCRGRRK